MEKSFFISSTFNVGASVHVSYTSAVDSENLSFVENVTKFCSASEVMVHGDNLIVFSTY